MTPFFSSRNLSRATFYLHKEIGRARLLAAPVRHAFSRYRFHSQHPILAVQTPCAGGNPEPALIVDLHRVDTVSNRATARVAKRYPGNLFAVGMKAVKPKAGDKLWMRLAPKSLRPGHGIPHAGTASTTTPSRTSRGLCRFCYPAKTMGGRLVVLQSFLIYS